MDKVDETDKSLPLRKQGDRTDKDVAQTSVCEKKRLGLKSDPQVRQQSVAASVKRAARSGGRIIHRRPAILAGTARSARTPDLILGSSRHLQGAEKRGLGLPVRTAEQVEEVRATRCDILAGSHIWRLSLLPSRVATSVVR